MKFRRIALALLIMISLITTSLNVNAREFDSKSIRKDTSNGDIYVVNGTYKRFEQIKKTYGKDFDYPKTYFYDDGHVKGTLYVIDVNYANYYLTGTIEVTYRGEVTCYNGCPGDGNFSIEDIIALKGYYINIINSK